MNKHTMTTTPSALPYVGIALVLGLTAFAGPAAAQIPTGGIENVTTDIWDFFIEYVGLAVVGLAIIGGLIGAAVTDTGRGLGKAIIGVFLGAMLGAAPAMAEYALNSGGAG